MKTVGVMSAGAWGTAIAKCLAEKGYKVQLWDFMKDIVEDINTNHANTRFLPDVKLPANLTASSDILEVADNKEFLIIATPSMYIMNTVKSLLDAPSVREGRVIIGVVTKGFLPTSTGPKLILTAMEDYLPGFYRNNLVFISGPSHAEEVSRGLLTGLISASANPKNAIAMKALLTSKTLMVFSSLDVIGVQVAAAVKNVIAIGFGILDALKENSAYFGDNTESLLLAAGLNEIQKIGRAMGSSHMETFTSIAGVGDLDVTCRSIHGRNRRFGRDIVLKDILAQFTDLEDLLTNISKVGYLPEGAAAVKYVEQLKSQFNLKLTICDAVYSILNKEKKPLDALRHMLPHLKNRL